MKKIIDEYIILTDELLLIYPKDKLVKSYLLKLKSLKNVPDAHLSELVEAIPLVYEALKEIENEVQKKAMLKIFSAMVTNTKLSVEANKIKA